MNSKSPVVSALHFLGALAFIVLAGLAALQARADPVAEAYVLGLICVSALGFTFMGASARESREETDEANSVASERRNFEQTIDATLAGVIKLIQDHVADGARFHESLAGADRKLSRSGSYDTIHEIVLTLINDNRVMQNKINGLSQKLEVSRHQILRLRSSLTKAEEIGNRDALTTLGNRRFFDNALAEEVAKAHDLSGELCVALADIDHFKRINDKFGHVAGDVVLRMFAELLTSNIKAQDRAARFGGEEFAILFPDCPLSEATETVNRIQKQLDGKRWAIAASGERIGAITASFGLAKLQPDETAEDLIRRADAKLYEAKDAGRNRVFVDPAGADEREYESRDASLAGSGL